ncbi:MAG: 3-hydroxyacyl-CoA dehydrogenase/enoyl-CoA hydratase family protein, partial [Anaerolineae bacterium]
IEVVLEDLRLKQDLMARIDAVRRPETIISSNTSGIPISAIAEGRSESFRKHFLGTHFFNPPRYLKLLELIPTADTAPEVLAGMTAFGERRMGKGVVVCNDTPNFIANRIGSVTGASLLNYALKNGYTVAEVDAITGPLMGRPKTATFRLLDLVGIDIAEHVRSNLAKAVPHDTTAVDVLTAESGVALQAKMIEKGWLGNKTGTGFYKTVRGDGGKEFWVLNLENMEHKAPGEKPRFESVGKIKAIEDLTERLRAWLDESDRAADLVRNVLYFGFGYAASCIPEVAERPSAIDDAVRWGFMHEAGPFEIWDGLGVRDTYEKMKASGGPAILWVDEMLREGYENFYQYSGARRIGVYDPRAKSYTALTEKPATVSLPDLKLSGQLVTKNDGASLIDLGDGIGCIEFHTKMNALDQDIGSLIEDAMSRAEGQFDGLVIGNDAENFSAGANLFLVVMLAQQGMWDQLDALIRGLQDMNMRMRYFSKPIVAAPAGLTLGGGAEVVMHASRVVAHGELYTGLVELGAGVIPAGGGTKEMLRRILNPAMRTENADPLPYLEKIFLQVGQAKVATSAEEAREFGILGAADRIVMNREHLLTEAKREALHMAAAGFVPPRREKIYAAGRDMLAALKIGIYMFAEGKYISAYDAHLARKLAFVMTGGELSAPQWVGEQYILDLEREAFLSLCGEEKTQQRMWALLQTGKPLRN